MARSDQTTALACQGGRIVAVGERDEVLARRGSGSEVVDLDGRLVLPAFTDAHIHFAGFATSRSQVDLKDVTSLEEAARRVGDAARKTPADRWITGRGWAHDK